MPIGFWALSRRELLQAFLESTTDYYPRWELTNEEVEDRVTDIMRRLPMLLDRTVAEAIHQETSKGEHP